MHSSKNASPTIKDAEIDRSLVPQTRLSPWWHDYGADGHQVFLKREDDGRFGMTSGKLRKFASILPWLKRSGVTKIALIGSGNSNQVLTAALLLREHGLVPIPFLKKSHTAGTNQFLLSLVVPQTDWHWIEARDWPQAEKLALQFVADCKNDGITAAYLPEGACLAAALPGAMTLAEDIERHALDCGPFTDIYIDAGTGLSAAALAMGMHERRIDARLHVTLMADAEEVFLTRFKQYCGWYAPLFGRPLPDLSQQLVLHRPAVGASYGSVNAEVLAHIARFAMHGVLTDPIYSAKHLVTVEQDLAVSSSRKIALVIHSGGAQALPGYAHLFPSVQP